MKLLKIGSIVFLLMIIIISSMHIGSCFTEPLVNKKINNDELISKFNQQIKKMEKNLEVLTKVEDTIKNF